MGVWKLVWGRENVRVVVLLELFSSVELPDTVHNNNHSVKFEVQNDQFYTVLRNRNNLLQFRFRSQFRLLTSYGSGSGSASRL
jgi:hypothetical protein